MDTKVFSGLWALRALFPSGGGRGMQDSCCYGVASCRSACGGCAVFGRVTIFSGVVWWSVVCRWRDYYNDRGEGVQRWQPRAMVSAAMVVSFLDAFCWWAFVFVCCCLFRILWLVEIQRRFRQLKNLLHVGIHESKVLTHFRVPAEHLFFFCSFLVICFF
jgi:hypothetical protein